MELVAVKQELNRLRRRNREIEAVQRQKRFRVILPELIKEYVQLEEEKEANLARINELNKLMGLHTINHA